MKPYENFFATDKKSDIIKPKKRFGGLELNERNSKALEKVHDDLNGFSKAHNREKLVILDLNKSVVAHELQGNKSFVKFDNELIDLLGRSPENSLILSHNHPSSSAFSGEDLIVLSHHKSLSGITVEGSDGTRYICTRSQGQTPNRYQIRADYDTVKGELMNKYLPKVQNGEMNENDAWHEHSHEINEKLAQMYGWTYRRVVLK